MKTFGQRFNYARKLARAKPKVWYEWDYIPKEPTKNHINYFRPIKMGTLNLPDYIKQQSAFRRKKIKVTLPKLKED